MSKKHPTLEEVRDYDSAVRYAKDQGWEVQHGGRHDLVVSERGKCALPRHTDDYGPGLRHAIVKTLLAMGGLCVLGLLIIRMLTT